MTFDVDCAKTRMFQDGVIVDMYVFMNTRPQPALEDPHWDGGACMRSGSLQGSSGALATPGPLSGAQKAVSTRPGRTHQRPYY